MIYGTVADEWFPDLLAMRIKCSPQQPTVNILCNAMSILPFLYVKFYLYSTSPQQSSQKTYKAGPKIKGKGFLIAPGGLE